MHDQKHMAALSQSWASDSRWKGIKRPYTAEDVVRFRGSVQIAVQGGDVSTSALKGPTEEEQFQVPAAAQ